MGWTISKIITFGFVLLFLLYAVAPMISQAFQTSALPGTNSTEFLQVQSLLSNYAGTAGVYTGNVQYLNKSSLYGGLFGAGGLATVAVTTGLTPSIISSFTGAAFVLYTMAQLITTLTSLGYITGNLIGSMFSFMPSIVAPYLSFGLELLATYIFIRLIFLGASAWSKYSLLDG